jgi:hypothetical protein
VWFLENPHTLLLQAWLHGCARAPSSSLQLLPLRFHLIFHRKTFRVGKLSPAAEAAVCARLRVCSFLPVVV